MDRTGFPPLNDDQWPSDIENLRTGFAGQLNVYRVMAHHPALLRAWAPLRQHVVLDTALGRERSEIVILRTACRLQSEYEWAHHVSRARQLGLTDTRIAAVAQLPDGEDGLLVRATDVVIDDQELSHGLVVELSAAFGPEAMFDLIATVGFYSVLGTILRTCKTSIDEKVSAEMAKAPTLFALPAPPQTHAGYPASKADRGKN